MITLSKLYVHPIKSMRGLQLSQAQVLPSGLAFDRALMVTETDGTFITARQNPQMVTFTPALLPNGIALTGPDGESILVRWEDFTHLQQPTEVWGNHFSAQVAPPQINDWLSRYFKRAVQLRWLGNELSRRVKHHPDIPLTFADGYPFLLINEASFQNLQQRAPNAIRIEQFRPNIVVSGAKAFDEDSWLVIRIGEVIFDLVKPCSRCILTTVSTDRGRKHPAGEPLKTLQSFRTADNGDVDFGMNMIARSGGIIRQGDSVEILSVRPPRLYSASEVNDTLATPQTNEKSVNIEYQGQTFVGNNQQILLEQLEAQGIRIPYSCRAGLCGSCKITLVEGEVTPLKQSAISSNGTILSCSCIPKSSIKLS
ncbi:Flavodoxin reductases (ferredoxin-NADPH reductases) family 1 [Enterobacteriaceae bacterium bta3-1]|nr:Flavodoxin reductases (ferredoxin-NADPH reductases) family 1 [Enterobacteriaceae bacterium bta3-1]